MVIGTPVMADSERFTLSNVAMPKSGRGVLSAVTPSPGTPVSASNPAIAGAAGSNSSLYGSTPTLSAVTFWAMYSTSL